jgi:uncharacterized protein YndB with AHSA1/START domain
MTNTGEDPAARTVDIRRAYDVPAALLFEAFRKPEHVSRWFGPKGYPLTTCEMDFRVGGRYRFAMTGPDGVEGPAFGGEYREIVPNERIVYTNAFELPDAEEMLVTVLFEERAGGTTLTVRTLFASVAMKDQFLGMGYEQGFGSALDQLGDVARELARP